MEAVKNMLYSTQVHVRFWEEAIRRALYMLNRSANETLHTAGVTPYKAWYKRRPSIACMKVFGTDTYKDRLVAWGFI